VNQRDGLELDGLELALRKLSGVIAVGFDGATGVHLLVATSEAMEATEVQAQELARLHLGRPLTVVIEAGDPRPGPGAGAAEAGARGAGVAEPPAGCPSGRVALGAVRLDGDAVTVTLSHDGVQGVGRGPNGSASPAGAAAATLAALRQLGWPVPFDVGSAARLAVGRTGAVLVHLSGPEGERLGVGVGETAEHAAATATLQALDRWLDRSAAGL